MITSRDLDDLVPALAALVQRHIDACRDAGIDLLVTCTYRDGEAQAALWAQGRTAPGKIVTNARPGQSWHQWRRAYDVVPLINGKPVWATKDPSWARLGQLGQALGLEWAGAWRTFKEYPHFQLTQGLTLADAQAGKEPTA